MTIEAGRCVFDAAWESGVCIPRLCHLGGVSDVDACRLCLVEVEGQKKLQASCLTKVTEDMVVRTNIPRLREFRKLILELLFAERNHVCPVCVLNGACERQDLAAGYDLLLLAAGVSGTEVIAARQASLDMSSLTLRSLSEAIKAGQDTKSLGYAAAGLAKWAKALPGMFPPGTGQGETSVFSQARLTIWQDRAGFDQAAANYADATRRLASLAQASDKEGFTKQLDEVSKACASCHARYKAGDQGPPKK